MLQIKNIYHNYNENIKINLDNRLKYPITDLYLILLFRNKLTYSLNAHYLKLIPHKIDQLRQIKNILLKQKAYYQKSQQQTTTDLNAIMTITEYKQYCLFLDNADLFFFAVNQNKINLTAVKNAVNILKELELKKQTATEKTTALKELIITIETQIKTLWMAYNNKIQIVDNNITPYDLRLLNDKKTLSNNAKEYLYFYLRKIKIDGDSLSKSEYLNTPIIKSITENYNKNHKEEIIKAIDSEIDLRLKSFENKFLCCPLSKD